MVCTSSTVTIVCNKTEIDRLKYTHSLSLSLTHIHTHSNTLKHTQTHTLTNTAFYKTEIQNNRQNDCKPCSIVGEYSFITELTLKRNAQKGDKIL